jgi:ankyrin repeat protein
VSRGLSTKTRRISFIARYLAVLVLIPVLLLVGCGNSAPTNNEQFIGAAAEGKIELVKTFLGRGADVNARDTNGVTALMMAANYGHIDVVRLLLDKGADIGAKDHSGSTALMAAAVDGRAEVVKLLKARGAKDALIVAAMLGDRESVQRFIESGSDLNEKVGDGWTPLRGAAARGHVEVVKLLLDKGAEIDSEKRHGYLTTLKHTAPIELKDVAQLNLDKGPVVIVNDTDGLTALHRAALSGHAGVLNLLLDRGADANEKNADGVTAFEWASWHNNVNVRKILKERGAKQTLITASIIGDTDEAWRFLESGSDVNATGLFGLTALIHAANKDHTAVVRLLLDNSADINAKHTDGSTALMWASWHGYGEMVKLLLERGAEPNIKHNQGWTALMAAAWNGHRNVAKLLLDRGADLGTRDQRGYTASQYAKAGRQKGIMDLLRAYGGKE